AAATQPCTCTPVTAARWSAIGVPMTSNGLATAPIMDRVPRLGGAAISWTDTRSPNVQACYVQCVDPLGRTKWAANGMRVGSLATGREFPSGVAGMHNNNVIAAWVSRVGPPGSEVGEVRVQRISPEGALSNGASGLPLTMAGAPIGEVSLEIRRMWEPRQGD